MSLLSEGVLVPASVWNKINNSVSKEVDVSMKCQSDTDCRSKCAEIENLKKRIEGHCERIYKQSELLSKKAERKHGLPAYFKILEEMADLHEKKAKDYGTGEDPLANIRASEEFGIPAWIGAVLRGNDKMKRLKAFALNGSLANEGVEDSLIDLAAYAIIALVLFRESHHE